MAKVPISELRIRVWTPMDPRDPCIAKIGTLPVCFTGKTPMQAKRAADEFRAKEIEKAAKAEAAKEARQAALKRAREEKKGAEK